MGFFNRIFKLSKEPVYCDTCNDTGEIEVLVMGTDDTAYVDCLSCKNRPHRIRSRRSRRNRVLTKILES